ncbi:MAG: radical SAM protein [Coriobacteriia bacterium]|nr:radical SAM protein [Coriobacteriia bacterium]
MGDPLGDRGSTGAASASSAASAAGWDPAGGSAHASARPTALVRPLHAGDETEFQEPLSIECLAGYLAERGHSAYVFDRRLYEAEGDASRFWAEFNATAERVGGFGVVGVSVMTADDVSDALRIIERVRSHWPQTVFVAGGLYVTNAPEQARARFPVAVRLVHGEGEVPLLSLAADAVAVAAEHRVLTPDEWAYPVRPGLRRYARQHCSINLRSARGCSGACTFCATPNLPKPYRRWAARDMRMVVGEIAELAAHAEREGVLPIFNFVEDDFGSLARVEELDAGLRCRGLRIAYSLQLRGQSLVREPRLHERLYKRLVPLRAGGFSRLFIGLESVDAATLSAWRKPLDVDAMFEVIDTFKRAGIQTHIGYILWHQQSTLQGVRAEAAELYGRGLFTTKCAISRMICFPGSADNRREEAACRDAPHPPGPAQVHWERLSPECEREFARIESYLFPLYRLWAQGATLLPYAAARVHLEGSACDAGNDVERIERVLSACDAVAYRALADGVFGTDTITLARELRGEFDALCRARY